MIKGKRAYGMILGHVIALDPTVKQEIHFRKACGVARFAYNFGLEEWQRMYKSGEKPTAFKVAKAWNAHRKSLPWTYEVTKTASRTAIMDLGKAFDNFFSDLKKPKKERRFKYPRFKSKKSNNGFALQNDRMPIDGDRIRISNLGWVRMCEPLRLDGKVLGASVKLIGHRWHVSIHVETDEIKECAPDATVGIDLGISTLMTLSQPLPDGRTVITNPNARRSMMQRQKKLQRRISRQELVRRSTNAKTSRRQRIRHDKLRRLHCRIANIRKDAAHKATSAITAAFSTIVVEDLNVAGMTRNHSLAGSIIDASFYEVRRQLEYKAKMRGGRVVVADRFFPSSKTCSACGYVVAKMPLKIREWSCPSCGVVHDRDANAAKNLERMVGPAWPEPPLSEGTRGEIAALAASQEVVKLPSMNRELRLGIERCGT